MDKMSRTWFLVLSIAVVAALFGVGWLLVRQSQPQSASNLPLGSGFNPVYFDWASKKLIVETGGELEVQTGGVVDMQSGSTTTFAGTQTFDDSITSGTAIMNAASVTTSVTAASVAATGAVSGASGTFTTATIGSATITTLTATSTYTYYETVDVDATGTITANAVNVTETIAVADVTASGGMTATGGFVGDLTGNVTGNLTGNVVGGTGVFTTGTFTTGMTSADVTATGDLIANTATITGAASVGGVLTATGGVVGDVTGNVTGDTAGTHTGAVVGNVTGNIGTFTQTASIGTFLRLPAQTAITVTNGAAFTPTGTYQPIQAAGDVTPTLTMGTAGDVVILVNQSDVTVTMEGDATLAANIGADEDANINLGLNDTVTLWCSGSKWYCVAASDNTSG